jgi:hypothetical protein
MATLAQGLALLLAKPQPPWSTQTLPVLFKSKPLSLRSVLKAVDERVVLLFIEVRPTSLLDDNPSLDEFLTRWAAPTAPSGAQMDTIKNLQKIFQPLGITIVYISRDGGTIGIAGSASSLLKIEAITLHDPNASPGGQNQSGLSNLGQGLVGAGASFAAIGAAGAELGAASGLVAGLLVAGGFLGFLGVGLFVGVAIYQLTAGASDPTTSSEVAVPPLPPNGIPVDPTIGQQSCGLAPDNLQPMAVEQLLDYFNANGQFPELVEPGQLPPGVGDDDGGGDGGAGDGGGGGD